MPHLLLLLALLAQPSPADKAWQAGQKAMEEDRLDEAIGQFHLALRLDAGFSQAHLSLAAAHLALDEGPERRMHRRIDVHVMGQFCQRDLDRPLRPWPG